MLPAFKEKKPNKDTQALLDMLWAYERKQEEYWAARAVREEYLREVMQDTHDLLFEFDGTDGGWGS